MNEQMSATAFAFAAEGLLIAHCPVNGVLLIDRLPMKTSKGPTPKNFKRYQITNDKQTKAFLFGEEELDEAQREFCGMSHLATNLQTAA